MILIILATQVISRHELLQQTIGVREEEIDSYKVAQYLPIVMTTAVVLTSLIALISFLLYNYKVGRDILINIF